MELNFSEIKNLKQLIDTYNETLFSKIDGFVDPFESLFDIYFYCKDYKSKTMCQINDLMAKIHVSLDTYKNTGKLENSFIDDCIKMSEILNNITKSYPIIDKVKETFSILNREDED